MIYEEMFITALIITIVIETVCLYILARFVFRFNKKKLSLFQIIFAGFIASFSTLPYLWFVIRWAIRDPLIYMVIGELIVFAIEAVIYLFVLKFNYKKAIISSAVCNLASILLGLVIFNFI